jgi:hypothetical protein
MVVDVDGGDPRGNPDVQVGRERGGDATSGVLRKRPPTMSTGHQHGDFPGVSDQNIRDYRQTMPDGL